MKGVRRAAACVVWLSVSGLSSGAQQPSPRQPVDRPTVIISGRVISADVNSVVLRGARIAVAGGGPAVAPVFTDESGRYSVAVPSDYALAISKAGFAPAVVTGRASGQSADLTVRLARGAVIEGQVLDGSGFTVSNARVRARRVDSAGGGDFTADTDDAGAYRIGSLPAGRYQLHSERAPVDSISALVDSQLHEIQQMREQQLRQRAPVPPMSEIVTVDLRAGEHSAVTLFHQTYAVLPPDAPIGGFVSGVVSDEFGDPLAGIDVRLWRLQYSRERYVAQATGLSRRTDDRGQFRLFYVPPGRYLLAAASDDPRVAPVFYPGVTELRGALPLIVGRKQEVPGVGIQFRRAYGARIFGFALNAAGDALRGTLMLQARRRSGEVTLPTRRVTANVDGTFEFLNVPPGEYALTTGPAAGGRAGAEFALQFVSVDGSDALPITIRTAPTATISGRVEVEGAGARPTVAVGIAVDSDYPLTSATLPVGADGTFVMHGLAGPVRFTMRNTAPGWWLKAVTIAGTNAAEEPVLFSGADSSRTDVTVVLSSSAGDLSGRVVDERGEPAGDYRVVVFSTDRDRWFVGSQHVRIGAGPDFEDRFTVRSLPPGDYFAAAVDGIEGDAEAGEWQNPDVLAALSTRGQRVTVGERQRAVADLRLIRWAR